VEVVVHEIAVDGLPDMDQLTGRVAFLFDGYILSGWPLGETAGKSFWEACKYGNQWPFKGVTHWVEFPVPVRELESVALGNDKESEAEA
jgi:hypothetical protein